MWSGRTLQRFHPESARPAPLQAALEWCRGRSNRFRLPQYVLWLRGHNWRESRRHPAEWKAARFYASPASDIRAARFRVVVPVYAAVSLRPRRHLRVLLYRSVLRSRAARFVHLASPAQTDSNSSPMPAHNERHSVPPVHPARFAANHHSPAWLR